MGNQTNARSIYDKISKLISSSRYNEAFLLLKNEMKKYAHLKKEFDKLTTTEKTYRYMLDYISEGNVDPSRFDMMEQIRDVLRNANEIVWREANLTDSSDLYSSTRRLEQLRKTNIQTYLDKFRESYNEDLKNSPSLENPRLSVSQATSLDEMFNYVWTMNGVDNEEYEVLSDSLNDDTLPEYYKALMISSIILGNLNYFDPVSFEILLSQYEQSQSSTVKARALVGILLISLLHSERIAGNINLYSRFLLSAGDEAFKNHINDGLLKIIRTYDTNRIDNKMRNEVIPGLMKMNPEILDKFRNMASESEDFLSDGNPNWEEFLENSELGDKLREINELQLEGADVMVTAFSNLKNFPFFNNVSNWFLPFIKGHYLFESLPDDLVNESSSRMSLLMCDSDINSFILSLTTMPEQHRNKVIGNFESQLKEAKEALGDAIGETEEKTFSKLINHSLQDLYRFFKFFRKKADFKDPFANPFLSNHIEPLLQVLSISSDNIRLVAEFYFKNKYFAEAAGMFELYDKLNPGDFNVWEKIGFCYDRMGMFDKAAEWYLKADLVNPDNTWLHKKIAISLKNAGEPGKASEYYKRALDNEPENYHLLMSAAQCFLDNDSHQEALKHFYHAQYIKPEKIGPLRAIAWTELLAHNFDKASNLYQKLIQHPEADNTDFLNTAHSALAVKDFKSALNYYRKFVDNSENKDITNLVLAFKNDAPSLKKIGIPTADLRLIIDKIRYDLFS